MSQPQIAVIDDETLICDLVAEALSDQGFEVHCAQTRDDGAALLTSGPFAMALIDAKLPDGSGLSLVLIAANTNTPTVVISGHPDAAEQCEKFGFPFISKPFGIDTLCRETARILANKEGALQRVWCAIGKLEAERGRSDERTS